MNLFARYLKFNEAIFLNDGIPFVLLTIPLTKDGLRSKIAMSYDDVCDLQTQLQQHG